jgi:antitoxin component YwqK of YwqJK toxin-antitoxin module
MNKKITLLMAAFACIACGCGSNKPQDEILSQTYIHKYGYAVSKEEWQAKNYPGQVISSLRNGITVTATYEDGQLQGPCTFTYPHSHTVEKYVLYHQNTPVKEILYDITGMPSRETTQLMQNKHSVTTWYTDGVPRMIEEYSQDVLLEGQYFTPSNELESRVENGTGTRIVRDSSGLLLCKDTLENGALVKKESFYANGSPESIAHYFLNELNGQKKTFTASGEPLSIEEWANGHLHGVSSYYKNGMKEVEIFYLYGKKTGLETHFIDGTAISHQISWEGGIKHGPETFFLPEGQKVLWNYDGKEVSKTRFQELTHIDAMISESSI